MRRDNVAFLAFLSIAILSLASVPVKAFIYPDGSLDTEYEVFGSRLDKIQIIMYDGETAMWTALQNGEIDVTDYALTPTWLNTFTTAPGNQTVQVTGYGGEPGVYILDFNLNNNEYLGNPPGIPIDPNTGQPYPNPVVNTTANIQNPCSDLHFRRGVNYLFNRTWYQGIMAGLGIMIYTPVPSYMGSPTPGQGAINQNIRPGGSLEALTYPYNETKADEEFALANMVIVPEQNGGNRFWDRNLNSIYDAGEEIVLNFNARQDVGRRTFAENLTARMQAHGFVMDTSYLTSAQNYQESMLNKNYHMTTLGWIWIGPDVDYLYDLYHITAYWHDPESVAPNTQCLNDTETNYWAESIKFNETYEGARLSAWKFQERFATVVAQIPLFSNDRYKAHSRTYVGRTPEEAAYTGDNWLGLCNQGGLGDTGWYTFENAHPDGHNFSSGDMTIRYGWRSITYSQYINPLYSDSTWDAQVSGRIYDTLGRRDPYDLSWKPYLVQNWTLGTWLDVAEVKSKVTITLRPDVYFTDGVQLTADDVIYSLTEVSQNLIDLGYPAPWFWSVADQVKDIRLIDPYNLEILFKVKSYLAESWALGGFYIIPKHIWKPIIDSGDPTAFTPDPNVIGSGPWRYVSMTPGVSLLMVANKPGSVVTTDRLGSSAKTSPGVFNYYPVDIQAYEQSYLTKFPQNANMTFKVRLNNLWTDTPVTVDKYITITNPAGNLNATLDSIANITLGIVLTPIVPNEETFTLGMANRGKIWINVTIVYQTAPFVGLVRSLIVDPWITRPEDIGGGWMGTCPYLAPDGRVDGKDIAIAARAFGTRPGDLRWSPLADITGDYKIDAKDIVRVAKYLGWPVQPA